MSNHERMARIEGIDLETGAFLMTLATEGEAADGHILSIKGGQIPERLPMLTSHWNDPASALGSITNPEKFLKDSPPRLRAVGHIEMGGEGASAAIRRDLAHMIDKGHVRGMSIRWDEVPGKSVRRVNLPSDHPHFVDAEKEKSSNKRYGMYFEEWIAVEGSLVALGADKQALIGRAEETDGAVSTFWRAVADDLPEAEPTDMIEDEEVTPEARVAASLAALRTEAGFCHGIGASHADMINAVVDGADADVQSVELGGQVVFLPEAAAAELRVLIEPEPEPEPEADEPFSPDGMARVLERLEALEAMTPTLEEECVPDEPLPSPERESAEPLAATRARKRLEIFQEPRPLEALQRQAAAASPRLQAELLRRERKKGVSPLSLARMLKEGLDADRAEVVAMFRQKVKKHSGDLR
jgi:hypothetical protein